MKKKIIILSDLSEKSFNLAKKVMDIFSSTLTTEGAGSNNVKIFFYEKEKNIFLDGDREIENIDDEFLFVDSVVNLLDIDKEISIKISQKIELLNMENIQNSLDNRMVFSLKNNIKKIFNNYSYKTPIFELLGDRNSNDAFFDCMQPSRIFSKKNHYFSEKIDSKEKMEKVFLEIKNEDKNNLFIEEYIEGDNFYSFVFKKEKDFFSYTVKEDGDINLEDKKNISEISKEFFKNVGLNKFALIHFKKHKKRGLFFLNIFVELDILDGENRKILDNILEQENVDLKNIFKI
jgi:hypothetical protein